MPQRTATTLRVCPAEFHWPSGQNLSRLSAKDPLRGCGSSLIGWRDFSKFGVEIWAWWASGYLGQNRYAEMFHFLILSPSACQWQKRLRRETSKNYDWTMNVPLPKKSCVNGWLWLTWSGKKHRPFQPKEIVRLGCIPVWSHQILLATLPLCLEILTGRFHVESCWIPDPRTLCQQRTYLRWHLRNSRVTIWKGFPAS